MQNETEGDHGAICAVAASATESNRFRDEFRALREKLRSRVPEADAVSIRETFRPAPRMEAPPINVVIHEREAPRVYSDRQPLVPRSVSAAGKVALLVLVVAGIYYGPSYHTCHQMKQNGLFYFGTTVGTCVQERLAQRGDPFAAIKRSILPIL